MKKVPAFATIQVTARCPQCGQKADYTNDGDIKIALAEIGESIEMHETKLLCDNCDSEFIVCKIIFI